MKNVSEEYLLPSYLPSFIYLFTYLCFVYFTTQTFITRGREKVNALRYWQRGLTEKRYYLIIPEINIGTKL